VQRFGASLLAVTAAGLALAATAHGNFVGTGGDPPGDASDPSPGRDIIGASLSYERGSGELVGAIQFRAFPGEARSFVTLYAGTRTASGCDGMPFAGFGSYSDEFGASWKRMDDPTGAGPSDDAQKITYDDAVTKFEATDDQLVGYRLDCVIATASEPGNPANAYDVAGPFDLVGQPALSMRVRGVGRSFKPNRPRKLKITLANEGDGATSPVRLRLGRARGLQAKPATQSFGAIEPGGKKTVTLKVKLSGRARDTTKVKLTASAGELVARENLTLVLRRPGKPGNGRRDRPTQTCTRWMPDPFGDTGGSLILVPC
jgi:hypothetical protein